VKERARFCLACGARLRAVSEHGRRRRRCPRCGWTFYDNPVFASVAIICRRGRMLLAKRANPPYAGTWDLPGGFIEAGETPEAGMRRELREELSVGNAPAAPSGLRDRPLRPRRLPRADGDLPSDSGPRPDRIRGRRL